MLTGIQTIQHPHGETFDRLYKSIPFLIGMKDETAFGIFFDNHFETHFDMGRDNKTIIISQQ